MKDVDKELEQFFEAIGPLSDNYLIYLKGYGFHNDHSVNVLSGNKDVITFVEFSGFCSLRHK